AQAAGHGTAGPGRERHDDESYTKSNDDYTPNEIDDS
nr:hypothetical protein [Tanacetum cinerariifolium]